MRKTDPEILIRRRGLFFILNFVKMKKKLKQLLLGERIKGEKLSPIKPFKERIFDAEDFHKWCKEMNVSLLHNRKPVYLN